MQNGLILLIFLLAVWVQIHQGTSAARAGPAYKLGIELTRSSVLCIVQEDFDAKASDLQQSVTASYVLIQAQQ